MKIKFIQFFNFQPIEYIKSKNPYIYKALKNNTVLPLTNINLWKNISNTPIGIKVGYFISNNIQNWIIPNKNQKNLIYRQHCDTSNPQNTTEKKENMPNRIINWVVNLSKLAYGYTINYFNYNFNKFKDDAKKKKIDYKQTSYQEAYKEIGKELFNKKIYVMGKDEEKIDEAEKKPTEEVAKKKRYIRKQQKKRRCSC